MKFALAIKQILYIENRKLAFRFLHTVGMQACPPKADGEEKMKITKIPNLLQILRLCDLMLEDKVNFQNFESFLKNPGQVVPDVFPTEFDASAVTLLEVIKKSVKSNMSKNITEDKFGFTCGKTKRTVDLELASFLKGENNKGESGEEAAERLIGEGYILENLGELAVFTDDRHSEIKKYNSVVVMGDVSRWKNLSGQILIPFIGNINEDDFFLELIDFRNYKFDASSRVLVSKKIKIE
ncbi:MAG: hypothetical protein PHY40_01805 [Patescibacteria group bacterium]|nr:hypothetical protein [Patescibacteria group bacterium]